MRERKGKGKRKGKGRERDLGAAAIFGAIDSSLHIERSRPLHLIHLESERKELYIGIYPGKRGE